MLEKIVEESLQRLREHNKVSKAYSIPSRKSFKVTKNDLTICEYPAKGLKRKFDPEQDQENLQRQFDKAIYAAVPSLDSQEGLVDQEESEGRVDQDVY